MTKPYSNDLRERVLAAVVAGETTRVVAKRFGVAVSTVVKWHQRYRKTGSVWPGKVGGHRKRLLEPHRDFIIEAITRTPHLTLHGLKYLLAEQGIKVSHNAVWHFLRREGVELQKKLCLALSKGAPMWPASDVAGRRLWAISIPGVWFSSMRPGSKPIWHRFAAGGRKANACAALRPTATGIP